MTVCGSDSLQLVCGNDSLQLVCGSGSLPQFVGLKDDLWVWSASLVCGFSLSQTKGSDLWV